MYIARHRYALHGVLQPHSQSLVQDLGRGLGVLRYSADSQKAKTAVLNFKYYSFVASLNFLTSCLGHIVFCGIIVQILC